jgi:general secretion pathway protein K
MTAPRDRGFALLIVLWTMVFLAFLMTQILGIGRNAVDLSSNIRAAAQARAADDGAINEAVFHLLASGPAHWKPGGASHPLQVGAVPVQVGVRSLDGMVNPNLASESLLDGLLLAVGVGPDQAKDIANAIVFWRAAPDSPAAGAAALAAYQRAGLPFAPPARPFAAIGELGDVMGMTPDILARLAPHLSLFQPGDPDPTVADPVVAKALTLASAAQQGDASSFEGAPVVAITACAAAPATLCRRAVVSLPGANAQTPFLMLALE